MSNTQTVVAIDDWYEIGLKLYRQEQSKFIADRTESDLEGLVRICHKNGGKPVFFKYATKQAFEELKAKVSLERITIGRGSVALSGWHLAKEGKEHMRTKDRAGKSISRVGAHSRNGNFTVSRRSLPTSGSKY